MRLHLLLPALLASLAMLAGAPAGAAGLPPVAAATAVDTPLFVGVIVNGEDKGAILAMRLHDGHPIVDAEELAAAGLPLGRIGPVDLATVAQVRADYDAAAQQLRIDAAPALLPTSHVAASERTRVASVADMGVLLNYNLYLQHAGASSSAALWSEQRLFGAFGTLSNNGTVRAASGAGGGFGYRRYDTRYRFVADDKALAITAGDLITRSLPWSSSVRLGGVQIARDFRVRPDLLTMPLPSFAGETAVPSAVDLFVNGFRQQSAEVSPGRFVLDRMPVVNGAGEASIVTTDAVGRQIVTTIPFYVASELLRPGLIDGGAEIGFLRRGYGLRNFDYGALSASGSMRRGMTQRLTLEAHGEANRRLVLAGGGITWSPGRIGVIDLSAALSRHDGTGGRQLTIGYSYVSRRFSVSAQHIERTDGYRDLGTIGLAQYRGTRSLDRLVASTSIFGTGAFGLAYVGGRTTDGSRTRLVSGSFSRPIRRFASLFAGFDHDLETGTSSAQLRLIVPFGHASVSGGGSYDRGRGALAQVDFQRAVPSEGGVGLAASVATSEHGSTYGQASGLWRGRVVELQAGGATAGGRNSIWAGATGTIVAMDRRFFAANMVSDAFAVVSTDGVGGVPISYENQPLGVTDRRGHLFVPNVTAYHPGRFGLDPLALDESVTSNVVETRLSLREGVGAVVHMPVRPSRSVQVALVDADGAPLAPGGRAMLPGDRTALIGWDGLLFFQDPVDGQPLEIIRRDGGRCRATIALPGRHRGTRHDRAVAVRLIATCLAALLMLLGFAGRAEAACQTGASSLTFGSASSYTVRSGGVAQSSGGAGFTCNGSLISLLSSNFAKATVTSASGFKLSGPGGDTIPYTVSADPAGTFSFNRTATIDYMDASMLSLLTILNGGTFAPKLYAVPTAGANVAAGTYTDTLSVRWDWNICHGIGLGGICVFGETGSDTTTITVTLTVSKDCRISAPAVTFGSAPLAAQFSTVTQAVAVDCTKGAAYTVAFTTGDGGSARPWRRMSDGAGHTLQYNLYRPDGVTIWDETNPLAGATTGTGALTPAQMQGYVAKVNPAQVTPPVGAYQDTVSVVVSF